MIQYQGLFSASTRRRDQNGSALKLILDRASLDPVFMKRTSYT